MLGEIEPEVARLHAGSPRRSWFRNDAQSLELRRLIAWSPRRIENVAIVAGPLRVAIGCRQPLAYHGSAELVREVIAPGRNLDLVILPSYQHFTDLLDNLHDLPADYPATGLPDIAILTDDAGILYRAEWHNRQGYEKFIWGALICVAPGIIYLSPRKAPDNRLDSFAGGALVVCRQAGQIRFLVSGSFASAARMVATINLFRVLLPRRGRSCWFAAQIEDLSHHDFRSVAYGRRRDSMKHVRLIPDPFFFGTAGYRAIRNVVAERALRRWADRQDLVFWRGSATHAGASPQGEAIEALEQVPRVAMCLLLRSGTATDAAITYPWGFQFPPEEAERQLQEACIRRDPIPLLQHADYRYLIDIDGAANAWSFFEKLLLGSCILKVRSPFEQWFYAELKEWVHYVPVRQDLADMVEKIGWCRANEDRAQAIAAAGQRFAMQHTYEMAAQFAREAIREVSRY